MSSVVGLVAADHTSAALLHLANIVPKAVPSLVVINDVVSYESLALSQFYDTPTWMEVRTDTYIYVVVI